MTVRRTTRAGRNVLVVDIVYRRPDGARARYRRDAQVQTLAAAHAEERRLLVELAQHGEISTAHNSAGAARRTFGDAIQLYRDVALPTKKASTRDGYTEIIDGILEPRLGRVPLDRIDAVTVQPLDVALKQSDATASRRRNVQIVVRSILRTAVEQRILAAFPPLPALPKVGSAVILVPTSEEVSAILRVASPSARLAFALSAYAGLRRGEVRALRWEDLELARSRIIVRRAMSEDIEDTPKSGNGRAVPIAAPLRRLLDETPKLHAILVAPNSRGAMWAPASLRANFQRCCTRSGIPVRPHHCLRHYFVTELFRQGAPAPVVMALAGHSTLAVTQRYAHHAARDLQEAVARLA